MKLSSSFFFFGLFRAAPPNMEVPRLGVKSELQLPAYGLHHSHSNARSEPEPYPTAEARDRTCVLMDASQIR